MIFILLYLTFLFIAPQLWVEPFVGAPVDFFLYPAWLGYCLFTGRFAQLFHLDIQDRFFLLMLVWIVLSMALKGWTDNSPQILQNYAKWFLMYRLTIVTVGDVKRLRKVAVLLLFFALVLVVEGIQHMHSPDRLGWAGQTFGWVDESAAQIGLDKRTRWINIFDGPGVFCVAYTIALPFALYYTGAPFGWLTRILGMTLVAPLLLGIYYTGARGGYLTAIAIIGLFVALKRGISLKRLVLGGLLGFVILMLAPGYVTSTSDSHHSAQHRVDMWVQGLEMARFNPVLGVGKGNFKSYSGSLIAHNSAIEVMGETGFIGLFLWIGMIYMAFKEMLFFQQQPSIDPVDRAYVGAIGLSIVGYLVSAMFVTLEYETFYMLLAMSAVVGRALPQPAPFSRRDAFIICVFMGFFFTLIKIFAMTY
ncbi:MAG: O-antigen ligase family protein [Betaproteobacteria bacterium]|nr:O-antigen ligase family protein [Betaproteobacteria bacterium]